MNDTTQNKTSDDLKIFALGGLYEVGKNMYCIEYRDEIIIIDAGILFPDDNQFGVDYIIPDYSYLIENQDKIKGLFITHGHEDHIGGIPYLLKSVKIPKIYANGLTVELINKKLEEHRDIKANIYEFNELEKIRFKYLTVSCFRVSHSIPDSFGIVINTPYGDIVESGDFKFDFTPMGKDADYQKLCSLGQNGVLLLMSDSTNAKLKDLSLSEKVVSENIKDLFRELKGRVIIATFASNVNRINQIIESSIENGRKVCVVGRSMENIVQIGRELNYIHAKEDNFISEAEIANYSQDKVTIICTGSQGEPMAALTRIASGSHKQIRIEKGDTVIFSSSAIPGNSTGIDFVINQLSKAGAKVVVQSTFNDVHASGHAGSNEQKLLIKLLRPKYFMPIHGEYYMLKTHAKSAIDCGIDPKNVFVLDNGLVLNINQAGAKVLSTHIEAKPILIDGMDIGGINSAVIEQRKSLSKTGMVSIIATVNKEGKTIARPTIISKGFLYAKDNEEIFKGIENFVVDYFDKTPFTTKDEMKKDMSEKLGAYILSTSKQNPSIFVILNQVFIEKKAPEVEAPSLA